MGQTRRVTSTALEREPSYVGPAGLDVDAAYQALAARDRRFDGRLWFGVTSTGVYCRPVCSAQTPKRANVRFFASPAAAVSSGFRACKRCRPDSAPGSRHWDQRGDLAARALRLIAEGSVDTDGVAGLAQTLHVSERHLHRTLVAEVGAGPLHLAMSRRAQTARLLLEQTSIPLSEIAFAAGFSSIRQFNDVMKREFGSAPSLLRRSRVAPVAASDPALVLRLRLRPPYDVAAAGEFLVARAVDGLEAHEVHRGSWTHRRVIPLPTRPTVVSVTAAADHVVLRSDADLRDAAALVLRVRRWLDLDADPEAVTAALGSDTSLAPLVVAHPGLRVLTTADPWETVVRAIVGQQITVSGARTILGRIVTGLGGPVVAEFASFPSPSTFVDAGVDVMAALGMPGSRARALCAAAGAVAAGDLDLQAGDVDEVERRLLALPGIGPWTASYVRLRALGDPDAFPSSDLGLRHAAYRLGLPSTPVGLERHARAWSPWRAYAAQHLWTAPKETP